MKRRWDLVIEDLALSPSPAIDQPGDFEQIPILNLCFLKCKLENTVIIPNLYSHRVVVIRGLSKMKI